MDTFFNVISIPLSALIGGVLTWWVKKPKEKADLEAAGIENVKSLISIYQKISEDLNKELSKVSEQCAALRKEVSELRKENVELKILIEDFRRQNLINKR